MTAQVAKAMKASSWNLACKVPWLSLVITILIAQTIIGTLGFWNSTTRPSLSLNNLCPIESCQLELVGIGTSRRKLRQELLG